MFPSLSRFLQTKAQKGGVRNFFKPLEIDDEIEENFDLSSYHKTNAGHFNNNSNEQPLVENPLFASQNEPLVCDAANNQIETSLVQDDDVPLRIKFQKVYSHYCEIKKQRAKWNGLNDKISARAIDTKRLPSIVIDYLVKCRKESNENRIYRNNVNQWPTFSDEKQKRILDFMSLLTQQNNSPKTEETKPQNESQIDFHPNSLLESQLSFSMQMDHQSKYASQLGSHGEQKLPTMQQIASSTPHKALNVKHMPAIPMHSPIVNAVPVREFGRIPRKSDRYDKNDPNWYLKYLGLNTVWDLFSGSDDDTDDGNDKPDKSVKQNEINKQNVSNKSDDQQAKLCDTLNKSICGNESFIEEDSQYTVSRILKICEKAENVNNPTTSNVQETTRRKRLYIGSVDDLFCHNDDDDDEDNDVIINTQTIGSFSDSDDTVNYDVNDAVANHNLHNSTNLFRDTFGGEQSNTVAKSVTCVRSDELFSTYNESGANVSKATSHVSENAAHSNNEHNHYGQNQNEHNQNIHSQSAHTPPKKPNTSNLITYHCRSPSVLIKSSSILSIKFENNQFDRSSSDARKTSSDDDSPLNTKLSVLNTQLSLSKHFEDFDEIKENFSSPFATCRSSIGNRNRNHNQIQPSANSSTPCSRGLGAIDATNSNCDTEFSDDDLFATCKPVSV